MYEEAEFNELDERQAIAVDLVMSMIGPGTRFTAYMPETGVVGDTHIILWDGSEETLHKLPDVLCKMAHDRDLPDFGIERALEVIRAVEEHEFGDFT